MRLGVLVLPEHRWTMASPIWRRADELGFDHAWTYDHIAWGPMRDSPWFSAIPTLTAAALGTTRIRLGTLVASPNFRHPVPFGRELICLEDVAGGRLTVGLGAGGEGWDATILGQSAWSRSERADRFAEFVRLLDLVLREPETSYQGRFYSADGARSYPGCVQQPRIPFAIAATGPRGMEVVARYGDVWVTNGDRSHEGPPLGAGEGAKVISQQVHRLEEACHAIGRDATSVDRLVLTGSRLDSGLDSASSFRKVQEAYAEAGITDLVVHWPRPNEPYAGDPAHFERVVS